MTNDKEKMTQAQLDELVCRIVPEQYWPLSLTGQPIDLMGDQPPVTNITVQKEMNFLKRVVKYYSVETLLKSMPRAYTLNWGELRKAAKLPWENYIKSSSIWINETSLSVMGMEGMEFILLHEIGHADWAVRKQELLPKWSAENAELYADFYAHQRLASLYDLKTADDLLLRFGSLHGSGKETTKYDA